MALVPALHCDKDVNTIRLLAATGNTNFQQCHFLETHLIVFRVRTQPATDTQLEGIFHFVTFFIVTLGNGCLKPMLRLNRDPPAVDRRTVEWRNWVWDIQHCRPAERHTLAAGRDAGCGGRHGTGWHSPWAHLPYSDVCRPETDIEQYENCYGLKGF